MTQALRSQVAPTSAAAPAPASETRAVRRRRAGFSLAELLIVMFIIFVLIGLTIAGGSAVLGQSKVEDTRLILQTAANAETEYQARTRVKINHLGDTPINFSNIDDGTPSNEYESIERFVWAVEQVPEAGEIINVLSQRYRDLDNDGFNEVIDAWGTPLRYASRVYENSNEPGLPVHLEPFLASAGPDQQWGTYDNNNQPDAAAEDNLFSYDLGLND